MTWSSEQHIEEILYEAHSYGFRDELFQLVKKYDIEFPRMSRVDRYQQGFNELVKKYEK